MHSEGQLTRGECERSHACQKEGALRTVLRTNERGRFAGIRTGGKSRREEHTPQEAHLAYSTCTALHRGWALLQRKKGEKKAANFFLVPFSAQDSGAFSSHGQLFRW